MLKNPGVSTKKGNKNVLSQIAEHLQILICVCLNMIVLNIILPKEDLVVWEILRDSMLYPHLQRVQVLLLSDFPRRMEFYQWYLQKVADNPQFQSQILFVKEANFCRNAVLNFHEYCIWTEENPHVKT